MRILVYSLLWVILDYGNYGIFIVMGNLRLWELWYIHYYEKCRIYISNRRMPRLLAEPVGWKTGVVLDMV